MHTHAFTRSSVATQTRRLTASSFSASDHTTTIPIESKENLLFMLLLLMLFVDNLEFCTDPSKLVAQLHRQATRYVNRKSVKSKIA